MAAQPILSVVMPLHHEGTIFFRTCRALTRAIKHAQNNGHTIEVIFVLDRADELTTQIVTDTQIPDTSRIVVTQVDYGNPGMTRNHGVNLASGKYVALIDGDNLFSENWLSAGIALLESKTHEAVAHSQYLIAFGTFQHIWEVIGSDHPTFDPYVLAENNYWDTMCITHTSLLRRIPHDPAKTSEGLGYEDWHWNGETLAAGIEHYATPDTVFFYRSKEENSMLLQYSQQATLVPPTQFLLPDVVDEYHRRTKKLRIKPTKPVVNEPEVILETPAVKKPVRSAILWTIRKAGKPSFTVLRGSIHLHQRANEFVRDVHPLLQRLSRPPGLPPVVHDTAPAPQVATNSLPDWLILEWKNMHAIEPHLFPAKHLVQYLPRYSVQRGIFTDLYWKLAREIGVDVDYLIFVPWLKKGGADKEVLNYVQALVEIQPNAKIVVFATNNTTSPWRKFLPDSVKFITMDKRVHGLAVEHQIHLIGTLMVQLKPKRIHVINSPLGYAVLRKHAKPISKTSKLFLLIFCLDHTDEGQKIHYVIQYLESIIPYIAKVFADNQKVINELIAIYNFNSDKFSTHYQPFSGSFMKSDPAKIIPTKFSTKRPLRILWAGRLDTQKRPDILLAVQKAVAEQDLPIEFHVYGSSHLSGNKHVRAIKQRKGITYHGPYDKGLETLPLADYDVFMMTSQWEGMPNVLLEATAGRLPIIAPAAGGVGEFITADTGYLIEDFSDTDEYISVLKHILRNYPQTQVKLKNAQKLLRTRHSWKSFVNQIKTERTYIDE